MVRLQPEEKLELVVGSLQADNVKEFCEEKKIDRSYLYQLRREVEQCATEMWAERRVGRPRKQEPDVNTAEKVAELERRNRELEEQGLRWRVQAELGYLMVNIFESAGLFEDKRVKKNLRGRLKRYLSQRPSTR